VSSPRPIAAPAPQPHPRRVRQANAPLLLLLLSWTASAPGAGPAAAQSAPAVDTNVLFPVDYIEARLLAPELRLVGVDHARPIEEDRSRRVTLAGPDGEPDLDAHWKPVAAPAQGFNNEPRYELAAYRFQRMFLDEPAYVVPPVVLRAMGIDEYRRIQSIQFPTIRGTESVLFLLSYWLQNLAPDHVDPFDEGLFELDETYARHFANANVLTHLIDHKDSNQGNVLVSRDHENRRVFSVDNDVAFRSPISDRGTRWRRLLVDRIPAETVERLRRITEDQLEAELGVVAEFRIVDGLLEPAEPGPNLATRSGVRVRDGRVQFGLTRGEISGLHGRIQRLIRDVDSGRIATF
jgi:hypothetical protein